VFFACDNCPIRHEAQRRPASWVGRLWRWHTRWCPKWRAYARRRRIEQDAESTGPNN
jgi:hypothetical protein